jgi:hypothetical protein
MYPLYKPDWEHQSQRQKQQMLLQDPWYQNDQPFQPVEMNMLARDNNTDNK